MPRVATIMPAIEIVSAVGRPTPVADMADGDRAEGPRQVAGGEDAEGRQRLRQRVVGREERRADLQRRRSRRSRSRTIRGRCRSCPRHDPGSAGRLPSATSSRCPRTPGSGSSPRRSGRASPSAGCTGRAGCACRTCDGARLELGGDLLPAAACRARGQRRRAAARPRHRTASRSSALSQRGIDHAVGQRIHHVDRKPRPS